MTITITITGGIASDDDDDDDVDVDGSYKDTRHSAFALSVNSKWPCVFRRTPFATPPPLQQRTKSASSHLPSNVCDLLQILRNLSSLYRILNLIMCDDIINFKMLTATQRVEGGCRKRRAKGREREEGREGGRSVWQPYKVQPELLLHMNWARKAEQGKGTESEEDRKQYVIYRVDLSDCYR